MSFSDTIFLFFLALILFGPKKLPEIARQAGRLLAELRRASNEFRSQIESEIAHLEVEKRQTASTYAASPPASMSLNPAAEPVARQSKPATLAASSLQPAAEAGNSSSASPPTPSSTARTEPASQPAPSTPQESHV